MAPAEVVGSGEARGVPTGRAWSSGTATRPGAWSRASTLARPPAGTGSLVLELDASGLALALSADGTEVLAGPPAPAAVLRYNGLQAIDATGRRLPAWLAVEGQALQTARRRRRGRLPRGHRPLVPAGQAHRLRRRRRRLSSGPRWRSRATPPWWGRTHDTPPSTRARRTCSCARGSPGPSRPSSPPPTPPQTTSSGPRWRSRATPRWWGRPRRQPPADAGSAYVFVRSGVTWAEQRQAHRRRRRRRRLLRVLGGGVGRHRGGGGIRRRHARRLPTRARPTCSCARGSPGPSRQKLTAPTPPPATSSGTRWRSRATPRWWGRTATTRPPLADAGSAYVFVRSGVTWAQQAEAHRLRRRRRRPLRDLGGGLG